MNGGIGSTRPSLHSEASRTVEYPSGSSSAEFLIASTGLPVLTFHCDHRLARWHEEEPSNALRFINNALWT